MGMKPFLHLEREVRKSGKARALEKIKLFGSDGKKRNDDMDEIEVLCIGAAIVDIPLQQVVK